MRDDLTSRVREYLELWKEERFLAPAPCALEGDLPEETPITPGCTVRLSLARYHPDDGWPNDIGPVGVLAAVNYGRAADETRNHWYYYVVWEQEGWEFERPGDDESTKMTFSSERGSLGWPYLWQHSYLDVLRDPWKEAANMASPETLKAVGDLARDLLKRAPPREEPTDGS